MVKDPYSSCRQTAPARTRSDAGHRDQRISDAIVATPKKSSTCRCRSKIARRQRAPDPRRGPRDGSSALFRIDENLVHRHAARRQPLLESGVFERLDRRQVEFHAERQRIVADDLREWRYFLSLAAFASPEWSFVSHDAFAFVKAS